MMISNYKRIYFPFSQSMSPNAWHDVAILRGFGCENIENNTNFKIL